MLLQAFDIALVDADTISAVHEDVPQLSIGIEEYFSMGSRYHLVGTEVNIDATGSWSCSRGRNSLIISGRKGILGLRGAADGVLELLDVEGPLLACQLCICLDAFFVVFLMKGVCMVDSGLYRVGGNLEEGNNGSDETLVVQGNAGSVCRKFDWLGFGLRLLDR